MLFYCLVLIMWLACFLTVTPVITFVLESLLLFFFHSSKNQFYQQTRQTDYVFLVGLPSRSILVTDTESMSRNDFFSLSNSEVHQKLTSKFKCGCLISWFFLWKCVSANFIWDEFCSRQFGQCVTVKCWQFCIIPNESQQSVAIEEHCCDVQQAVHCMMMVALLG